MPDWSPQGDVIRVADVSCEAGLGAISVIDARSGEYVSGGADCYYGCRAVSHSPDGRSYAYDPNEGYSLIAVERYGVGTVFLTRSWHWDARQPAYSPDGRFIAFTGRWIYGDRMGQQGIYTMRAADGRRKTLVVRDGFMPDWQPLR
jgi:Tol biopolymer transport system component